MLQLTMPAQDGGCHHARQGAVARVQQRKIRLPRQIGQHLLERAPLPQHARNEVDGQAARRQAFRRAEPAGGLA
jgi:hypothetical protein